MYLSVQIFTSPKVVPPYDPDVVVFWIRHSLCQFVKLHMMSSLGNATQSSQCSCHNRVHRHGSSSVVNFSVTNHFPSDKMRNSLEGCISFISVIAFSALNKDQRCRWKNRKLSLAEARYIRQWIMRSLPLYLAGITAGFVICFEERK